MKQVYTALLLFACLRLSAQPIVSFQQVLTGFSAPVDLVAEPGSTRMFIVEQPGTIRIWNGSSVLGTPFLNVSSIISSGGERGLLSLAFHPQYATNRYFFIWYTNSTGAVTLARYRRDAANPDIADPSSGVVLLSIPKSFSNHNGAKLNFGPDGYLYIGTGDGGSANDPSNNAQNGSSLLGKMLRIDVNGFATSAPFYAIPPNNPYVSNPTVADEIIALGLRNPWRWSFDKANGNMWIADVGQNAWEEVHFRAAADISTPTNYGWRCYEGTHVNTAVTACGAPPANNVFPIYEYPHNSSGGFVVTGGYVYRGTEYPSLQGHYIMVDYSTGNGWLITSNGSGGWNVTARTGWPTNITTFGEMNDGTLYAARGSGVIYKITANPPLPLRLLSFTGKRTNDMHELAWEVEQEKAGEKYILERSMGNQNVFIQVASRQAESDKGYKRYSVLVETTNQPSYYRLKMVDNDARERYSSIVYLDGNSKAGIRVNKQGDHIILEGQQFIREIMITDIAGKQLMKKAVNASGMISIPAGNLPKGILVIKVNSETGISTARVLN